MSTALLGLAFFLALIVLLWEHVEAFLCWSLARVLSIKLRTKVSIDSLHLRRWSVELRGICISNGPGKWEAPYAIKLTRFRVQFTLLGLISVIFPPDVRIGPLEFHLGFRIKKIETVEVEGLSVFLEDADEGELPSEPSLKQGTLLKRPLNGGFGSARLRNFVLSASRLSWFDAANGTQRAAKGHLKLFPSSSVIGSPSEDAKGRFRFDVVCGKDELTLLAHSDMERNEWMDAIRAAVVGLRRASADVVWSSNAAWMGVLAAEADAKKTRRRLWAQRRRREWQKRWQAGCEAATDTTTVSTPHSKLVTAADESEETISEEPLIEPAGEPSPEQARQQQRAPVRDLHDLRSRVFASRNANRQDFIAGLQSMARGATLFVERSMSNVSEFRVDEAVELQIGRFAVHGLTVTLHKHHTLSLGEAGWEMCGFCGSELDLKGRLLLGATVGGAPSGAAMELGLAATVLRDSGREAAADSVKRQVEEIVAGAQAKGTEAVQAATKTAAAVAAEAREAVKAYTGKEKYQFGDLTKTAFSRLGSALSQQGAKPKEE